jgi:hypothetical protein
LARLTRKELILKINRSWVFAIIIGVGVQLPVPSAAKEVILCKSDSFPREVTLVLSSFQRFGHTFNCVNGPFVVNSSGCAPNGAFGLHAPTGSAALVGVVKRWQDYAQHLGGITSNYVTDTEIYFSGGFNGPGSGYEEEWSFSVSRLTGKATLKQKADAAELSCEKSARKF